MPTILKDGSDIEGQTLFITVALQFIAGSLGIFITSILIETILGRKYTICLTSSFNALLCFSFYLWKHEIEVNFT
jgi:hypothetical protein